MTDLTPLVSVIIPVYNCKYIGETLNSVRSQTYTNIEITVIDDGSTDNTPDIISSFKDVKVVRTENKGVASARNEGLKECRGEFIAFIDADDIWSPDKTSRQVKLLMENTEYDLIYGRFCNFFQKDSKLPPMIEKGRFLDSDIGSLISLGTLIVRNDVIRKIGFFDEKLRTGEDLDWFIKMKESGSRVYFDDHEVMQRRLHSSNLSYKGISGESNLVKLLKASLERKRAGRS